ncbi:CsbD family protein [uncultured Rhodoblastus sp.]|uniref:CsbD family protein n=1 Tax=uncultured Rhodoblastus sp. TaxID=543037 RepID=UPI0025DFABFD|nr:CsbD family protein [uncultured Rhodoblastus sp.]
MVDKDRIAGSTKELTGAVKQAAGKAIGDVKLESQGAAEKTEGKIQNAVGGLKDTIKETSKAEKH